MSLSSLLLLGLCTLSSAAAECEGAHHNECANDDVTSLMQLSKPTATVREEKNSDEETEKEEDTEDTLDEHPNLMYNWGIKWDDWYNDMQHLFPSTNDHKGYKTMNYGFVAEGMHTCAKDVPAGDAMIQPFNHTQGANMYVELASKSPRSLKDAKVLEISSGRGGGTALLSDCYCPSKLVGMDFSKNNVKMSKDEYGRKGDCPIEFVEGDAMKLPFDDNSFDVIVNVESSHTFPSYRKFANEARRVLRPGGAFLHTDFRKIEDSELDKKILSNVFKKPALPIDVTPQVLNALSKNKKFMPFIAKCFETYKAKQNEKQKHPEKFDLHDSGMGIVNPLACSEYSGQFVQMAFGTGVMNYRMYAITK